MALDDTLRAGVKTIDVVTKSLQPVVKHYAWLSETPEGVVTYATVKNRRAIVEQNQKFRQVGGKVIATIAKITFVEVIPPSGSAGSNRTEPIDTRDKLVLSDGTTGPIVETSGVLDPDPNRPYVVDVWLGAGNR